jgi:hypothetical protein
VFTRLGNILLIVAMLATTGSHWLLLQSVAWTTMLAGNLQSDSFVDAVEKTFDGRHPCCMCKEISAGKKSEKKTEFAPTVPKLEFVLKRMAFVFAAPRDFTMQSESPVLIRETLQKPPTPPPRFFFA